MNTPQTNQQDLVVFHILPRLGVRWHLALAAILIAAGITVQALLLDELIGALLLLAGTLFLTAKGYDSRIKLVEYDPTTTWEPAGSDTLLRVRDLAKRARRWDRSALDVSNWLGCATLGLAVLTLLVFVGGSFPEALAEILLLDAAVLILPHWLTGIRRGQGKPEIVVKARALLPVYESLISTWPEHDITIHLCMKGLPEKRIPTDVKIRVERKTPAEGSLGATIQCVLNHVQGTPYPYIYAVMVAKPGLKLRGIYGEYGPPSGIIKEWSEKGNVEVAIIRQHTTRTSGYHTREKTAITIAQEAVAMLETYSGAK